MGTFYSGAAGVDVQGVDINDQRRMFNFGERVAELAPQQSPFFVYLSKVGKKPTDDPVFKFLEQRHQWQRRNFIIKTTDTFADAGDIAAGSALAADENLHITCRYTQDGRISTGDNLCRWILPGQVLVVKTTLGIMKLRIDPATEVHEHATNSYAEAVAATTFSTTDQVIFHEVDTGITTISAEALIALEIIPENSIGTAGFAGQVAGSAFAEGTGAPESWEDKMFDREGYCQIFKTAINLFSNTARATKYRGNSNEYQRVWQEKLMEHKMDIEHAMLFGIGGASNEQTVTGVPLRTSHGIVPYTEANGKVYNMTYASSGYDAFLDAMEDFFAPESGNSGNKLVLASRKVITYLNKLGSGSFLNNSVGSSQYSLDVTSIPGNFGHQVTKVNTIFGNLHFVAEPLLRGPWEDYCCAVDMKNVAYRPLAGNGMNRDTFIETNIQGNDVDGRRDQIITEAGLEISVPETHALLKWS